MWTQLRRAWLRLNCRHEGGQRVVQLGRALPGNDNPTFRICLDCGAVKLEDTSDE